MTIDEKPSSAGRIQSKAMRLAFLTTVVAICVVLGLAMGIFGRSSHPQGIKVSCSNSVLAVSIGVETLGGLFDKILAEGSSLPVTEARTYTTASDNQPAMDLHILQGFRPLARHNKTLAKVRISGIPPCPRGIPQLCATFAVDSGGLLTVKAIEVETGRQLTVVFESGPELGLTRLEELRSEATQSKPGDEREVALLETRNQASLMIYVARQYLLSGTTQVPEVERANVLQNAVLLEGVVTGSDERVILLKMDALQREIERVTKMKYNRKRGLLDPPLPPAIGSQ